MLGTLGVNSSTPDTHPARFCVVESNTELEFGLGIPVSPINS